MKVCYKSSVCNWIDSSEIKTKTVNYVENITCIIINCVYVAITRALNDEPALVNRKIEWFTAHRAGGIAWA